MATIRKRAPGQWQAQVRKRGYPLQTKTFPTRASAARWAQTVEYEITQGMFISRSVPIFRRPINAGISVSCGMLNLLFSPYL